jgi:two-component system sensor histidine kinase/response regulator
MSRAKILVVEDDITLLAGVRDILILEDYEIHTATDGLEALEVLQQMDLPPDLIVSDIMMPHMDGIEFLAKVRQVDEYISIPFIFLTAKGEKSDVQRGKSMGVDDYVIKPFNAEDLLIAIRARLDRSRAIRVAHEGDKEDLKRSILTILNHEFRTPLTFVVAYSDMLNDMPKVEDAARTDDGEIMTFLEGIRNGADRLRRLIENFILLVELETVSAAKTYEWRRSKVYGLDVLVEQAIDNAQMAHEIPRECAIVVEPDIPEFMGDAQFLVTALTHLIENAFKFSEPGQRVGIRVLEHDNYVRMEVTDEGRGIPRKELENIFRQFYQINRTHYEDQGAGSGLAIANGIVNLHGGHIEAISEPGIGSTFTLCIPLVSEFAVSQGQA